MTVTYNVLRFLLRISKVILSNFIHQLVIERKENKTAIYNKHQNTVDMQDYQAEYFYEQF